MRPPSPCSFAFSRAESDISLLAPCYETPVMYAHSLIMIAYPLAVLALGLGMFWVARRAH